MALAFSSHRLMRQLGKNPQVATPEAPCFEIALCTPDGPATLERTVATTMQLAEIMLLY
ncbi:hypothetical protein [Rhodoferax sp.]|uniref:hypothetical protein n=1 Tax=Rhodoferax sp. TaxID=50421 RepID=UPI002627E3A3|nr:hypothetical protein [Rhodoferax sp.]MDD2923625.1 hypothetical protein [Rhodoferax sp.]